MREEFLPLTCRYSRVFFGKAAITRGRRQNSATRRDATRGSALEWDDNDQRFSTCVSRLARVKVTRREGTRRVEEIGRGRSFYLVGLTRVSAPLPTLSHPRAHSGRLSLESILKDVRRAIAFMNVL